MRSVNLAEKFRQFDDHWSPKIVGELNDCYVKLVKLKGEFVWHHHDAEDELFLVVLRRTVGGETHFLFISFWDSMEAIGTFAGDDVERAHYYPEDRDYLLELEPTVQHYEVSEQ